jgi:heterodisulfide reductase subunit A
VTQRELEEMIIASDGDGLPKAVVMIQCVGSRNEEHPYCSRVCCTEAVKNALAIKGRSPDTDVYILYRDVRTFGFRERYYREARQKGVIFMEYDDTRPPQVRVVNANGQSSLAVEVFDPLFGQEVTLHPDLVVLSAGIESNVPADRNQYVTPLPQLLRVPTNEDEFFLEAHVKLRPLDFAVDGVYLCGLAHSPRFVDETIAQARGAAMRAVSVLSTRELETTPIVASVDPLLCTSCGQCIEVCPYGARELDAETHSAKVIEVLCQGCGACIATCPNNACQQRGFETMQIYEMIDALGVSV